MEQNRAGLKYQVRVTNNQGQHIDKLSQENQRKYRKKIKIILNKKNKKGLQYNHQRSNQIKSW